MRVTRSERLRVACPAGAGRLRILALRVEATVEGPVDPASGMVVNLVDLKRELRRRVIEPLDGRVLDGGTLDGSPSTPDLRTAEQLALHVRDRLAGSLAGLPVARIRLIDEPQVVVECHPRETDDVDVTRRYEFSASHRLHSPGLSADENLRVFGKCNNPAGHGHNYGLEVTLRGTPGPTGELLEADAFDRLVEERVVDRWDHRNLNEDLEEFAGVNPTAEEIVRVAWDRLEGAFAAATDRATLHRLKLRETDRNHVEYSGPGREAS